MLDSKALTKIQSIILIAIIAVAAVGAGVAYILNTYANLARKINPGIIPEKISCHSIRHSKAMHLLQAGVNLVYIRDLLGHVSVQTTDVYARADSKQKREAFEKAYVGLNPNKTKIKS